MKLLIIEHEQSLLAESFKQINYQVDVARDTPLGLQLYRETHYDLIIMDCEKDYPVPYQMLSAIRKQDCDQKIILFSNKEDIHDSIQALTLVERDYVLNSNEFEDMASYTAFLLNQESERMAFGNLIWNHDTKTFQIENTLIDLAPVEYTVFEYLLNHAGNVISAGTLINHATSKNVTLMIDSIKELIGSIRTKLLQYEGTCVIDTIRGQGYIVMRGGVRL